MDPLSITASVVTLLQLTTKAIKYLVDVQDAPKECQSCRTELLNLLPSLISLKDQAERAQVNDPWFEQVRRLNVQDGPLDQYKHALELLLSRVGKGKGIAKIKKRLLWKFEKEQVTSIQERIERLRSLIAMALIMDHRSLSEAIKADTSFVRTSIPQIYANISELNINANSVSKDTKKIRDAQTQQQWRVVLDWLSSTDYSVQLHEILSYRQEGTAQWFLDTEEFRQWLREPGKTLFCSGMPGAGKTMMAAVAVEFLSRTLDPDSVNVAYIFCNYKAQIDQNVSSILTNIVRQLVPSGSDAMAHLMQLYDKYSRGGGRPALDELFKVILLCVKDSSTFIIIDALDECSAANGIRDQLIKTLLSFQAKCDVNLLFTSRSIPEITDRFRSNIKLEIRADEEDVRRFIDGNTSRLPGFVQRNEALRRDIQNEITRAVDGMFLLARLYSDSICAQTSPKKVRNTLAQLQRGSEALNNAYNDVLDRIDGQPPEHKDLAKRALCWISYAERPLTAQELRTALAIEPGEQTLDADNMSDMDDIVSFCAGLVTVDQESSIVHLIHHTTQEYLQQVRFTWAPDMQHKIAEACLTYLAFEEFRSGSCTSDEALEERLVQYEFFEYVARYWSHHIRPVEQSLVTLALSVFRQEALVASITQLTFTLYPKHKGNSDIYPKNFTALHLVASVGLQIILNELLVNEIDNHKKTIDKVDSYRKTPLYYAVSKGHEYVVKLLLNWGADTNAPGGPHSGTLQVASVAGYEQIVKLLLNKGADVNLQSESYGTALQAASACGHEQIVELLLDGGANVNLQGGEYDTALQAASARGHEQIVRYLLDKGADVNLPGRCRSTALQAASACGHKRIVRLLLNNGPDANLKDGNYSNALQAASAYGHERIVRLLLDEGADVNRHCGYHGTALQAASAYGYEQIVKLLLSKGVDVNLRGGKLNTALQAASWAGHEQIVKLLLSKGADVNLQGGEFNTALHAALVCGHEQIVELLLDEGADVNLHGGYFGTARWLASNYGHGKIVKLLLDRGATNQLIWDR